MAVSDEFKFKTANRRARRQLKQTPTAVAARYDHKSGRIQVNLGAGMELMFFPKNVEDLEHATPNQLIKIEIGPSGFGLYFPRLDADLYWPALLEGVLGSKKWMAARLGAEGGHKTSVAKKRAARANGKLGGRPTRAIS